MKTNKIARYNTKRTQQILNRLFGSVQTTEDAAGNTTGFSIHGLTGSEYTLEAEYGPTSGMRWTYVSRAALLEFISRHR